MTKKDYIGIFESSRFHGVDIFSNIQYAQATDPQAAIYFMIRQNLSPNLSQRSRSKMASEARDKLSTEEGGAAKIIYEIEDELEYQDGGQVSKRDPDYKDALTGFLASEISKRKGGNELKHLHTAKEAIRIYLSKNQ